MNRVFAGGVMGLLLCVACGSGQQKKSQQPVVQKKECDPSIEQGMGDGYRQYRCSSQGKWIEDVEGEKRLAEIEAHRLALYWALRTRILTPKEEEEAYEYGDSLNTEAMVSYMPDEKARELNDAWFQQRRLQRLAKLGCDSALRH